MGFSINIAIWIYSPCRGGCSDVTNDKHIESFINRARVARLATINSENKPHLVPVVFAFDGKHFLIPVDKKRKKVKPEELKRIKNIQNNPNVALLIDEYNEDWTKLAFVMVQGKARIITTRTEENIRLQEAYRKLVAKYSQYQKTGLCEMCIIIKPEKVTSWRNSQSEL
jgi:PPOX class probable F420-dependent enzyme